MRQVYILLLPCLLLSQRGISQIDLALESEIHTEYSILSRSQINGNTASCTISNLSEIEVNSVFVEFKVYKLPNQQTPIINFFSVPFDIGANETKEINSEAPLFIGYPGEYKIEYSLKNLNTEDINPDNNKVEKVFKIGSEMARDNGESVSSIGIGNGVTGEIGQTFKLNNAGILSRVNIFLENATAAMTGEEVKIRVYQMNDDNPGALLLSSDPLIVTESENAWVSLDFPNTPLLSEGNYLFAVVEGQTNLNLGQSDHHWVPGTTWFRHDNLDWTDTESYDFTKPFMIRPEILPSCVPSYSNMDVESCEFYISEDGLFTWFESGEYELVLPSYNYCDSIVTLNLNIDKVNLNLIESGPSLQVAEMEADEYQWFDCETGIAIEGATEQHFTPEENGTYQVRVIKGTCDFFSECITVTTVGTLTSSFSEEIELYPNPNNGYVNINMNQVIDQLELQILDIKGNIHYQNEFRQVQNMNFELQIPAGTYIIYIKDNKNRVANLRMIKH